MDGLLFVDDNHLVWYGFYYNGEDVKGFYDVIELDSLVSSVNISLLENNFTLYPNPTQDFICMKGINTPDRTIKDMIAYDSKGGQYSLQHNTSDYCYHVSNLTAGKYTIVAKLKNGKTILIGSFIKN